jgi:protein-disulfide isomerase
MTSGKQARRQRQAQARPPVRSTGGGRQASGKVLLFAAAGIVGLAAAIGLAFAFSGGSSSSSVTTASTLPDAAAVTVMFKGIPQRGNVLGKPSAPATMVEYIDLQCPICRAFETETMPSIIARYVRTGKLRVEARTIAFIGPDSERGRLGTIAAGRQNRLFDFAQLLYANQGPENSGWLDDTMVASAAKSIPGVNVQELVDASNSNGVKATASQYDSLAKADAVGGTPAIYIGKTGGTYAPVSPETAPDAATVSAAIERALVNKSQ